MSELNRLKRRLMKMERRITLGISDDANSDIDPETVSFDILEKEIQLVEEKALRDALSKLAAYSSEWFKQRREYYANKIAQATTIREKVELEHCAQTVNVAKIVSQIEHAYRELCRLKYPTFVQVDRAYELFQMRKRFEKYAQDEIEFSKQGTPSLPTTTTTTTTITTTPAAASTQSEFVTPTLSRILKRTTPPPVPRRIKHFKQYQQQQPVEINYVLSSSDDDDVDHDDDDDEAISSSE